MPLLHQGDPMPPWSELHAYRIIRGAPGERIPLPIAGERQKLIIVDGRIRVRRDSDRVVQARGQVDLPPGPGPILEFIDQGATVWMIGAWGDETGGSGVFVPQRSKDPGDRGDPVNYPKETNLDRHYHDCDEYWIIVNGSGVCVSEGRHYEVGPGDCVATRMGHHHDFPIVHEAVTAVYFETTLRGQKRRGHLWEHMHGPAEPIEDHA